MNGELLCIILFLSCTIRIMQGSCAQLNNCSGHGQCQRDGKCSCHDGWGSRTDFSRPLAADCSERICPTGAAWSGLADYSGEVHIEAECSNAGICNRKTGMCECFSGYSGSACQRKWCLNDCSGHGRCVNKRVAARNSGALPVNTNTKYGERRKATKSRISWDAEAEYVCICDSSWVVGADREQRSDPEWFGRDCSLRHCPSANNPATRTIDETNCTSHDFALNPLYPGVKGSLCHVDCAGQGLCDYSTGTCSCFPGFIGADCGQRADYEEIIIEQVIEATDDYYYSPPVIDDDFPIKNTPLDK